MNIKDLYEILEELHPEVDFETCTTLIDDKILNSFDIVTTIAEIADVFDVTIPASAIIAKNFNSAQALFALIESLEQDDE